MMSGSIFVESAELMDAAGCIGNIINCMDEIKICICRIDNTSMSYWQGKAAAQNVINFSDLDDMIAEYLEDAARTKKALDDAIVAYQRIEQEQSAKVGNLDPKGIF